MEPLKIAALKQRSQLLQELRAGFCKADFVEVTTAVKIPAPAPEEYIESIPCGREFLRTSPELAMKRMICGGMERTFQIGPAFRAEERGRKHREEFTILEDIVAKYSHSGYLYTPDADDQPLYVIHRLLSDYTSTEKVKYKHYLLDGNSGNLNWKSGDYVDIQSRDKPNSSDLKTEPYTYLDTPYQIYYKYCQQNGYLPPEPETEATA